MLTFLSACVEGILQSFTNFYLRRKLSIFLRNDRESKAVDLYNTRKRYTVIESWDLMRNIPLHFDTMNVSLWIYKVQEKDTE